MATNETIAETHKPFLEKIQQNADLENIYDAKELTEIVYRTMRDLIPRDMIDDVAEELEGNMVDALNGDSLKDIWKDTNPLVSWISKIRPRFKGKAPFTINDKLFITRVEQEGGLPNTTTGEKVISTVFSATKEELSAEKIAEIGQFLPGKIAQMWQEA